MNAACGAADVDRFRAAIARSLGLWFDDTKLGMLAELLQRRAEASGYPLPRYLDRLENTVSAQPEFRDLAGELTVGETYFFRHVEQLRAFAEIALPDRISAHSAARQLRILSAGCASGDEPYSLAILVRERMLDPQWSVTVRAVDINAATLARAMRARYPAWALRETPADIQRRWFRQDGKEFALDPAVLGDVAFQERNLAIDDPDLWQPEGYDVVFCRNVMMYFTPENAQRLIARITKALVPGGYLFLGHAETLRGVSQDFHLCHTHGTFYYQRKAGSPAASCLAAPLEVLRGRTPSPPAELSGSATWIENVQRAAERIRTLSERSAASGMAGGAPVEKERKGQFELGIALDLLKTDSFPQALALVDNLPPDTARDPDVLLLRAILLTHGGRIAEAEQVCGRLLESDELSAGAHYVLALCRESAGDRQGAADHDQAAVYLDPTFAMARLHLGLLARRAADREAAQREIGQAVALLQREESSRLLMFGGGFSREALIALCRAELSALGVSP